MARSARAVLREAASRVPGLLPAYRRLRGVHDSGDASEAEARAAFATEVKRLVAAGGAPTVALLPAKGWRLRAELERACPAATVREVPARRRASYQHAFLAAHGPYDVLVDARRPRRPVRELDRLFGHVREGGALVVRAAGQALVDHVATLRAAAEGEAPPATAPRPQLARYYLGRSLGDVRTGAGFVVLSSRRGALAKLREREANLVIRLRRDERTRLLELRPAPALDSRCRLRENLPGHNDRRMPARYQAPDASLRAYADALCAPRQIVVQGNLLLPDSYRHNGQRWLHNRRTVEVAPRFARMTADASEAPRLPGTYFHLDSELPGHFGHTMTEQVARLWGWPAAQRRYPGLKALVGLRPGNTTITAAERQLFEAIGIDEADVVTFSSPVVVERLVAATPMLSMPYYVNPDIAQTWGTMGDRLAAAAPEADYPRKLFCSRRIAKRSCRNTDVVEGIFRDAGFEVVFPEEYPLAQQVRMFREADTVAGFAGSALFTLMFVPTPKRSVVISSESYTATNEYLISSVLGHSIDLVWCPAEISQPERGYSKEAFESDFAFDVERDGGYLRDLLAST